MINEASEYFVRIERRVRGPFSRDVLESMFARGRIAPDTEVSSDRSHWKALHTLGEPFASGSIRLDDLAVHAAPLPTTAGDQYFCTIEGETQGPMRLDDLQRLVSAGRLEANDQVWQEGQPDWIAAGQMPGLVFVSRPEHARSWLRSNPALFASIVLMLMALFALPTYYVFASAAARKAARLAQEAAQKEQEARDRQKADLAEKIAREVRQFAYQISVQKMQHEEEMARLDANNRDKQAIERRHKEELAQRQRQHDEQMQLLRQQIDALKNR